MGLISTKIYTSELILCFTICVYSATRHNIHRYLKGPLIIIFRIDATYGCISLFFKPYMKMRTVYKRGTFSAKMVYKRVRGWISGRSLPVLNFVKYPPPPRSIVHNVFRTLVFVYDIEISWEVQRYP